MTAAELSAASPAIPMGNNGPVFEAPWQARVFAMTLQAHDAGLFTWPEWAAALGAELARDGDGTAIDTPGYYDHWLAAFEALLTAKGVATPATLNGLRDAWDAAARATPHGAPIKLHR